MNPDLNISFCSPRVQSSREQQAWDSWVFVCIPVALPRKTWEASRLQLDLTPGNL